MKFEPVIWKIIGLRPLMQSNPDTMSRDDKPGVTTRTKKSVPAFDEAVAQLYRTEDGQFFHPAIAFWKVLFVACPFRKLGKMAASSVISMAVAPLDEEMILCDPTTLDEKTPRALTDEDWMVDKRRVVNKKAGSLIAARPKWKSWGGLLVLEIDREVLSNLDPLTEIMNIAGRYGVGVGRLKKVEGKSEWGGLSLGKFSAELK